MDSALAQWDDKETSTPDKEWAALQQVVYNTAKTYIGKPNRKHQDWFDPNDQEPESVALNPPRYYIKKDACRLLKKNAPVH